MPCSNNRGFSYVEMLVSTALIGIMYMIYFGAGSASFQKKAKADCAQNLRKLHLALNLYADEHKGNFPPQATDGSVERTLSELVPMYVSDLGIFVCPGTGASPAKSADALKKRPAHYAYYQGLTLKAPAEAPLLSDPQIGNGSVVPGDLLFSDKSSGPASNHRQFGGNVLFVDGHVETSGPRAARIIQPPPRVSLIQPK